MDPGDLWESTRQGRRHGWDERVRCGGSRRAAWMGRACEVGGSRRAAWMGRACEVGGSRPADAPSMELEAEPWRGRLQGHRPTCHTWQACTSRCHQGVVGKRVHGFRGRHLSHMIAVLPSERAISTTRRAKSACRAAFQSAWRPCWRVCARAQAAISPSESQQSPSTCEVGEDRRSRRRSAKANEGQ